MRNVRSMKITTSLIDGLTMKSRKMELRIKYYDENGNICSYTKSKSAHIISVNGFTFNNQQTQFKSYKEIKTAAYMFLYRMYNIADGIATQ